MYFSTLKLHQEPNIYLVSKTSYLSTLTENPELRQSVNHDYLRHQEPKNNNNDINLTHHRIKAPRNSFPPQK